jgi:hypothetical protein
MTAFIQQSGIAKSVYLAAVRCFRHLPGGHAIGSIVASALNATVSISSQSNAAVLGSVALSKMKRDNQDSALSVGDIAAVSTITLLIPPSLGLILYAILSELSIVKVSFTCDAGQFRNCPDLIPRNHSGYPLPGLCSAGLLFRTANRDSNRFTVKVFRHFRPNIFLNMEIC